MPETKPDAEVEAELEVALEFLERGDLGKNNSEWKGYVYGIALALAWVSQSKRAQEFLYGRFPELARLPVEATGPASDMVERIRSNPDTLAEVRGEPDRFAPETHAMGMTVAAKEMHLKTTQGCVKLNPGDVVVTQAEVFRREALDELKERN